MIKSVIKCALPFFLLVAPQAFADTFSGRVASSGAKTINGYLIGSQGTLLYLNGVSESVVFKKTWYTFSSNPSQKVFTDNQPLAGPVLRIAQAIGTNTLAGAAEIDTNPDDYGYGLNQLHTLAAQDNSSAGIANRIAGLLINPNTQPSYNMWVIMGDGKEFYPTTTEQAQVVAMALFRHKPITYTTYCGYVWDQRDISIKFSNQYNSPVGIPGAGILSMCGLLSSISLVE